MLYQLFIFMLLISSNTLLELFPCSIQRSIRKSMIMRHILGFIAMFIFVISVDKYEGANLIQTIFDTFKTYGFFMIMTKNRLITLMLSISIIIALYVIEEYKETNRKNTEQMETLQNLLRVTAVIVASVGFLSFMGSKKLQYKHRFNYYIFMLGKDSCANNSTNRLSFWTTLRHAFD